MATHFDILAWRIHGQRSLVGFPSCHEELDTTEVTYHVCPCAGWTWKCPARKSQLDVPLTQFASLHFKGPISSGHLFRFVSKTAFKWFFFFNSSIVDFHFKWFLKNIFPELTLAISRNVSQIQATLPLLQAELAQLCYYFCCCCVVAKLFLILLRPHGLWPAMLLCPWDSPGKKTGSGCHFLFQGCSQPRDGTHVSCIGY